MLNLGLSAKILGWFSDFTAHIHLLGGWRLHAASYLHLTLYLNNMSSILYLNLGACYRYYENLRRQFKEKDDEEKLEHEREMKRSRARRQKVSYV